MSKVTKEIMLAMPINQLASLCLTIAYKPNYTDDNSDMIISTENVVIPQFDIEDFINEANEHYVFGLEESPFSTINTMQESVPTIFKYLECFEPRTCPHIISAFYIDELGKASIVASGLEIAEGNWEVAKGFFR